MTIDSFVIEFEVTVAEVVRLLARSVFTLIHANSHEFGYC